MWRHSATMRSGGFGRGLAFGMALVLLFACGVGCGGEDFSSSARKGAIRLEGCGERGGYCGVLEPGGQLTAAAWLDDDRMYLADVAGRIRLLDVETGKLRTVLTNLSVPQGLTVLNERLYVTDMGNVCDVMQAEKARLESGGLAVFPWCAMLLPETGGSFDEDVLLEFLGKASARVLSYPITDTGDLGAQRVIVDRIVTIERQHSPNGLVNDGEYVYVSIGHPQVQVDQNGFFVEQSARLRDMALRVDLMGVIARIDSSDRVDVYATGLRNTYGITIAPDGEIYGGDNDEDSLDEGKHQEELNRIVEGGFYGFPFYGTNNDQDDVIEPVAILNGSASTAAYANVDGIYISYISEKDGDIEYVIDRFEYDSFLLERIYTGGPHYIVAILERDGFFYVATHAGDVHVIDPSGAPVRPERRLSDDDLDRVLSSDPVIVGEYDVYLDRGRAVYVKSGCVEDDTLPSFMLHVVPVNVDDLSGDRREHGFENLDFTIADSGWIEDGRCVAVRSLPRYDIALLVAGQYIVNETDGQVTFERIWTGEFSFLPEDSE